MTEEKQNSKQKRRLGGGSSSLTDDFCPVVTMDNVNDYQKKKDRLVGYHLFSL